jgi:thymidylate synthase (FAD)
MVMQLHAVIMTACVPSWQWHNLMAVRGAVATAAARGVSPPSLPPVRLGANPTGPSRERRVPEIAPLKVQAIAWTHFEPPADVPWDTDAGGGEALAEFAGRACYQSWSKPNPATATNAGYLRHILEVGHLSVLEHGSVTFYLSGVSRSLTHELIRHRHFSYSQLSQRYVPERNAAMVEPEVIAEDPELHARFVAATDAAVQAYTELLEGLEKKFADVEHATLRRKQARQAARAVLPNATETRIVVTGNYRAWRHFIAMRASEHADVEIRELAVACLRELQRVAPNAFADFEITSLPDGTEVASSPLVSEG